MGGLYDDIGGSYPTDPTEPEVSTLQWPWDAAAPPVDAGATPLLPGASGPPALDQAPPVAVADAAPPAPPAPIDDSLAGAPGLEPPADAALAAPPPMPYDPGDRAAQPPFGPAPPTVAQLPDISIHDETSAERFAGHPLDNPNPADRQGYLNDLAQTDPAAFAELQIRHDDERRKLADTKRAETITRDHDAAMANLRKRDEAEQTSRAKTDQLLADATRIANTKIDPSGGVHGIRRIAGVIGAIVGGLVQGKTGAARNAGLDALNETIAQGIDAQKADLANQREGIGIRKGALAQEHARHGDDFHAAEAVRLASLKYADDMLATEQQNYDPQGTTALRIAGVRAGVAQAQAQAVKAYHQKRFDNDYKLAELADKQDARTAAARQHAQDQSLGYARLDFDQRKDARDVGLKREELDLRRGERADARDLKRTDMERELALGTPTPRLKLDESGAPVVDASGKPVTEAGELRQRDGSLFLAPDKEARKALADKTLAASEVSDIINRALDIRDRVGGESGAFNSDESQQLKVLQNRLVILAKSGTQGMSSDEDMKKISAALGADDISSFRARAAGLREGRDRSTTELNKAYRIAKYDGPKIEFANPYAKGPENTAEDEHLKTLLKPPGLSFDDVARDAVQRHQGALSPDQRRDPALYQEATAKALDEARASWDPDASPDQQRQIAELGQTARGDTAAAAAARQLLLKVSTQAQTARLRGLAAGALESATTAATLGGGEPEQVR